VANFTAKQKAEAIAIFHSDGSAVAAQHAGCSRQTIYNWLRDSIDSEKTPEELQAEALYQSTLRASIRRRLLERVDNLLDRFDQPHSDFRGKDAVRVTWDSATSGDVRSYATAIGILIDKYRLEMGEATARTMHEDGDDFDRAFRQLTEELRRKNGLPADAG
jgi:transposase-like protein